MPAAVIAFSDRNGQGLFGGSASFDPCPERSHFDAESFRPLSDGQGLALKA
jgi:hypothetical protein